MSQAVTDWPLLQTYLIAQQGGSGAAVLVEHVA